MLKIKKYTSIKITHIRGENLFQYQAAEANFL